MILKSALYGFMEALPEYFRLESNFFLSGWRSRDIFTVPWLQPSKNESLSVVPAGVEPTTDRLEICCSIQLSYGTNINTSRGRQIRTADLHVPNVAR